MYILYFLPLGKLLLMLQSVKRAHAINRNHPKLHEHIVKLAVKGSRDCCILLLLYNGLCFNLKPFSSGHLVGRYLLIGNKYVYDLQFLFMCTCKLNGRAQ